MKGETSGCPPLYASGERSLRAPSALQSLCYSGLGHSIPLPIAMRPLLMSHKSSDLEKVADIAHL